MVIKQRNNLDIYDDVATDWWSDGIRWVRTLKNLVPPSVPISVRQPSG